jgi:23S rRNA pseudouridine2605 synthase
MSKEQPSDKVPGEKIQKALANAGYGSRRKVEEWIKQGLVKLNGQTATLGQRVDRHKDRLYLRGKVVNFEQIPRKILLYHKPVGEICTRADDRGRKTVFGQLPTLNQGRWVSVGRLDINSSGLLLCTTDGQLANRLMHPSANLLRTYRVRMLGDLTPAQCEKMQSGVMLEDGLASFKSLEKLPSKGVNQWINVTLSEGRNREVRRLLESQDIQVNRLIRTGYGPIILPRGLYPGQSREATMQEESALLKV